MINLDVLDRFAKDHIQFEIRCSHALREPCPSKPSTDEGVAAALHNIRTLVMDGNVDDATSACQILCDQFMDDPNVQLSIRVHKLFELIRITQLIPKEESVRYDRALADALRYSQGLATFSLDASPDAYDSFRSAMMLFAFPDKTMRLETLLKRRKHLADQLVSLTRMTLGVRESQLSFLLRYLLLIYAQFKYPLSLGDNANVVVNDIVCKLLDMNPANEQPATAAAASTIWRTDDTIQIKYGRRNHYNEAQVQALRERVNISRQESIESLRFTDGNVLSALRNELGRVVLDRQLFRDLVIEYCATRGMDVFELSVQGRHPEKETHFPDTSSDGTKVQVLKTSLSDAYLDMFAIMRDLQRLAEKPRNCDHREHLARIRSLISAKSVRLDFRICQYNVMNELRKNNYEKALMQIQETMSPLAEQLSELFPMLTDTMTLFMYADDIKSRAIMVEEGSTDANAMTTEEENSGDNSASQFIAADRPFRGPDDPKESAPEFQQFLKGVYDRVSRTSSIGSITQSAFEVLESKHGESRLVRLMKALLVSHEEWETETMMSDQFENNFRVRELRSGGNNAEKSVKDDEGKGRESGTGPESSAGREASSQGGSLDQNAEIEPRILLLMEFLNISRAEAISALRNHPNPNNTQAIMESLLGSLS